MFMSYQISLLRKFGSSTVWLAGGQGTGERMVLRAKSGSRLFVWTVVRQEGY
jgi:hypothetical protein